MSSVETKTQTTPSSAASALSKEAAADFKATYLGNDKSKAVARLTWLKIHTDLLSNNDVKDKGIHRLLEKLQLTLDEKQCESKCTLGHWVAWTDEKEATQQLLLLLKTIAEIKSSPYQIILVALLQQQDKDGWTLAHTVARFRDAQSTQAILTLLATLAKKHPKNVLAILAVQTQSGGLTFAHMVARYQNAQSTQVVLTLLATLAKKHPKDVLAILAAQTQGNDWNLAHVVARSQDVQSTQAVLTLLTTLAKKHPKDVLAILTAQNLSGWALAHMVARYRDAQSTQAVLTLLAILAKKYPKDVLVVLAAQTQSGSLTFAHMVARYRDAQSTQAVVTLLTTLVEKHPKDVLAILAAQTQSGSLTFAHIVARNRDAQSTQAVLTLLETLAEKHPKDVLAILAAQDHRGRTLAHMVARYQDAQSMQVVLRLLENAISKTMTAAPENSEAKESNNNVSAVQKKMRFALAREILKYDGNANQDTLFDLLFKNSLLKEVDQTSIIYDMLKKGYMPTTSLKSLAKKEGMKAAIAKHILALQQSDPKEYKSARVSLKKESQLLAFFTEGGIDLTNEASSVFQLFPPMLASSPSTSKSSKSSKSSLFNQGIEMGLLGHSRPLRAKEAGSTKINVPPLGRLRKN